MNKEMQDTDMNIPTTVISDEASSSSKTKDAYLVYVVFEIPNLTSDITVSDEHGFLSDCLHIINHANDIHLHDATVNSRDYFTNLNHAERVRIPKTLRRLNRPDADIFYGILAFEAFRHEPVKNKAFNQRVTSINPDILVYDRLQALFVPLIYPHDLSHLGHPIVHEPEGFIQINLLTHRPSAF